MGWVSFLTNVGYNFQIHRCGIGTGVDVKVTDMFDLYGEYFPLVDKNSSMKFGDSTSQIKTPSFLALRSPPPVTNFSFLPATLWKTERGILCGERLMKRYGSDL